MASSTNIYRDLGLGNHNSHMQREVSRRPLSLVGRLVSRSHTGSGLGIQVHSHYSGDLHLVWKCEDHTCTQPRCCERCIQRMFTRKSQQDMFTESLCTGGLTGTAT
jgi:hypothetical protein